MKLIKSCKLLRLRQASITWVAQSHSSPRLGTSGSAVAARLSWRRTTSHHAVLHNMPTRLPSLTLTLHPSSLIRITTTFSPACAVSTIDPERGPARPFSRCVEILRYLHSLASDASASLPDHEEWIYFKPRPFNLQRREEVELLDPSTSVTSTRPNLLLYQ